MYVCSLFSGCCCLFVLMVVWRCLLIVDRCMMLFVVAACRAVFVVRGL